MLHIAFGVCLGILAAVIVLNWWQAHLVRRAERRQRKAYRRGMQMLYPDRDPDQSMTPDQYQNQAVDRFAGLFILFILAASILIGFLSH